jgi:hypothetical protein
MGGDQTHGPVSDLRKTEDPVWGLSDEKADLVPMTSATDQIIDDLDLQVSDPGMPSSQEEGVFSSRTIGQRLRGLFGRNEARPVPLAPTAEALLNDDPYEQDGTGGQGGTLRDPAEQVLIDNEATVAEGAPTKGGLFALAKSGAFGPAMVRLRRLGRKRDDDVSGDPIRSNFGVDPDHLTGSPSDTSLTVPPSSPVPPVKGGTPKPHGRDTSGYPPIQVLIGWVGESSRKDVLEHARGFATDHIEALDAAWVTMAEFHGGNLFEVHEGGGGSAYLPQLIEELSRDPDQVLWVPSGTKLNRVVTISIIEGRPFSMMLNEAESVRVRASGKRPVDRRGKMWRLRPRGTGVFVAGATLFAIAFSALASSAFLSSRIDQQVIPTLPYSADTLPHGQIIGLSDALREDRWVSRILFEDGAWRAEFETFDELTLPDDTKDAQILIDEAVKRDGILQEERERKVRELRSE